ncbi:MAG TPA: DegT/DnrJ/EryC1/StrS family aminotransferase [Solirubrobacteraceae bacterium]
MPVPLFDTATPLAPLREDLRAAIEGVLDDARFILGPEVEAFDDEFRAYVGTRHAIGCANGTDAIVLALAALGIGPGDEVVVPSFTFYASVEPIVLLGAAPVFCDVDPATFLATPDTVKAAMTPKTKAVIAVHLFGNVAPVAEIAAVAGVPVVEDAAQAAGSIAPGGRPGALGTIGTFSFYPSKNLGAFGDGGAVVTDDDDLAQLVRTLRFHGSQDKVTYTHVGWNSRLDELQAAILRVQLPHLDAWAAHRAQVADWYAEAGLGEHVDLPQATPGAHVAWHLYVVRSAQPDALAERLQSAGIGCRPYYRVPVHQQPVGVDRGWSQARLPGTDAAARTHLALPMSAAMTREQVGEVVAAVAG